MSEPLPQNDLRWEKDRSDDQPVTREEHDRILGDILHVDEGHLYTFTTEAVEMLSQRLLWRNPDMEALTEHILSIPKDAPRGYLLEVDLDYPPHLHDSHTDLPFCPESKIPHPSPFTLAQVRALNDGEPMTRTAKLIMDLTDKREYVVHYRYLQVALWNSVLKKVHRVISFAQSPWLKSYVDLNTALRKAATNKVSQDGFKLSTNAIFGKTIEDVANRRDVMFVYAEHRPQAMKHASHPWMKGFRIMYEAWYGPITSQFNSVAALPRASLAYTDTDCFVMVLRGLMAKSVYRDLYEMQREWDFFDLSEIQSDPATPDRELRLWKADFQTAPPPVLPLGQDQVLRGGRPLARPGQECQGPVQYEG